MKCLTYSPHVQMFLPSAVYTAMNKGNDEGGRLSRLPGCRVCLRLIWNEVFSFQVLGIQDVFTHSGLFFKPSVVITTTPYCIYEKGTFTSPWPVRQPVLGVSSFDEGRSPAKGIVDPITNSLWSFLYSENVLSMECTFRSREGGMGGWVLHTHPSI